MSRKLIGFIAIVGLITMAWLTTKFPASLFPIGTIECSTPLETCPASLVASLEYLKGKSLFFTDFDREIAATHVDFYQLASIKKKLPRTIVLTFIPSQNTYVVELPEKPPLLVAESGAVRELTIDETLPKVQVSGYWTEPVKHNLLESSLHTFISALLTHLKKNGIEPQRIELRSPTEVVLTLNDNRQAILSGDQLETQTQKLHLIQKNIDLNAIDTGIKIIDLRFKLPVLKTQPSP